MPLCTRRVRRVVCFAPCSWRLRCCVVFIRGPHLKDRRLRRNWRMGDLRIAGAGAAASDPRPRARAASRARRATGSRWRRVIFPCRVLAPCPVVGGQRRPRDARDWRRQMGSADIERLPGKISQRLRAVACGTAPPVSCRRPAQRRSRRNRRSIVPQPCRRSGSDVGWGRATDGKAAVKRGSRRLTAADCAGLGIRSDPRDSESGAITETQSLARSRGARSARTSACGSAARLTASRGNSLSIRKRRRLRGEMMRASP